jgi:hypothetical protein
MKSRSGRLIATLSIGALLAAAPGCGDGPPLRPAAKPPPSWTPEQTREAEALGEHLDGLPAAAPGNLTVSLAFGPASDLDLYVTGPREETVYYANTPSGIGGALTLDRRCVHDAPRVETVEFSAPLVPGRYRVGVDYPEACGRAKGPAPFALRVDGPGAASELEGLAAHRVFEPIVLELEIAAESQPEQEEVDR